MRYKGVKGKAWEKVRKYIIERDGGVCITCGKRQEDGWQMQAGHFQPVGYVGSNNRLSWDEDNIYAQCSYCNGPGQGRTDVMAHVLRARKGKAFVDTLQQRAHKVDPLRDWQSVIDEYTEKHKKLQ